MLRATLITFILCTYITSSGQALNGRALKIKNDVIRKALIERKKEYKSQQDYIYYIKTEDWSGMKTRIDLCCNDRISALQSIERTVRDNSTDRDSIDFRETKAFYENSRINTEFDRYSSLVRVFKCSYYHPTTASPHFKDLPTCGIFNQRVIKSSNFLELVELLANRSRDITTFIIDEGSKEIKISYYDVRESTYEGSNSEEYWGEGGYSDYELFQKTYKVNRSTGEVQFSIIPMEKSERIY